MTETEIREMYARYANVLNRHDPHALHDLVSDEAVLSGHPVPRESVIAAVSHNIDAVPHMRWELTELLVDGDRLAVRAINTGTPTKEWIGVPPSGAAFTITEMAIYRVEDGLFTEMTFLQDSADLLRQLSARSRSSRRLLPHS